MRRSFIAGVALLAAISSASAENVEQLARRLAGTWTLTHIAGAAVRPSGRPIGFTIAGMEITGFDGCNTFGGNLKSPESIVATLMACAPDTLSMPLDLGNLLEHLRQARRKGGTLHVAGTAGKALRFARSGG